MAQSRADRVRAQRALARQQRAIRAGRIKPTPLYEPYRLALARQRTMRVIAQDGYGVDPETYVKGMTKAERSRNAKHANAVKNLLRLSQDPEYLNSPEGQRKYNKL